MTRRIDRIAAALVVLNGVTGAWLLALGLPGIAAMSFGCVVLCLPFLTREAE